MKAAIYIFAMLLVVACKEEKEEPIYFETTAPAAYTFPDTEASATFTVSGNTAWVIDVTEGRDRCSVTPVSGKGDATVTVRVAANPAYLQERNMALVLTSGDYTKQVAITQAAPPCPDFNSGAIATAGQTVTIGGTPITINSEQNATGGDGQISYQWYKDGIAIPEATMAFYTPPVFDVATRGEYTYTRRAKDNTCNTTLIQSTGSWTLAVVCDFNAGAITTSGQTLTISGTPETINSVQDATGSGIITYQWYKNGNLINGATAASYTPPPADAITAGAHTYTRHVKENTCNTAFTQSDGVWILTVTECNFNPGAIATSGQTVTINGTPAIINNTQAASGGDGVISYQWHKNGAAIDGATAANYTPPPTDAVAIGATTYTRRAKDNTCNTTLTPSAGSWVLTVICGFDAGAIDPAGQTIVKGGTPATINSTQAATGGDGAISYQWYKNGTIINGAIDANYTPPPADAGAIGAHTYTRRAKDNTCNTELTQSEGSWVLTVVCDFNAGAIATEGQTIIIGSTPATINSTQDATGNGTISYQWYKNDILINGATAAYYTPPQADANTVGATTYTRRAKDNTCNITLTLSAGNWVLTVYCPEFSAGAIAADGQTICSGNVVNTIPSSVNASGGDGTITYEWRRNGSSIGNNAATYTPTAYNTTAGTHTFTRWARDGSCKTSWTQSAGSWALVVTGNALLTLTAGTNTQYVANGAAIDPIKYSTANASTVNVVGLPDGITYDWTDNTLTISGSSTVTGTHSFIVTATGASGCGNASATGSIIIYAAGLDEYGCLISNITLGTVGFASTVTHVVSGAYGSQTWSAPVTATYCEKSDYRASTSTGYMSDCRNKTDGPLIHYFSWCMVVQYGSQLCPSTWRVPLYDDYCVLDKNLTNRSYCGPGSYVPLYTSLWGAAISGCIAPNGEQWCSANGGGYWSSDRAESQSAYALSLSGATSAPAASAAPAWGYQLRCVKD
jgi:hypothetical protein